jgi:tetratricopeptide (TPR) repeat protein
LKQDKIETLIYFEKSNLTTSDSDWAHFKLAQMYARVNDIEKLLLHIRQALQLSPNCAEYKNFLTNIVLKRGGLEVAEKLAKENIDLRIAQ